MPGISVPTESKFIVKGTNRFLPLGKENAPFRVHLYWKHFMLDVHCSTFEILNTSILFHKQKIEKVDNNIVTQRKQLLWFELHVYFPFLDIFIIKYSIIYVPIQSDQILSQKRKESLPKKKK